MKLSYDPAKRAMTLAERGLDFEDAPRLFAGRLKTVVDDRFDYGEVRWLSYGWIDGVAVAIVWTDRGETKRIISMRRMHDEEVTNVGLD
jgi:uncharacterized DUF497 family protein